MADKLFYTPQIIVAIIAGVAALLGAYFTSKGESAAAEVQMVEALYFQVNDLQKLLFEQQKQLIALRAELAEKADPTAILKSYMNQNPYPAWVKKAEGGIGEQVFRMWHINPAYERQFGVRKDKYLGKLDKEIWPPLIAAEFERNDREVVDRFDAVCKIETVLENIYDKASKIMSAEVCKWPFMLAGNVAVAGQLKIVPDYQMHRDKDGKLK